MIAPVVRNVAQQTGRPRQLACVGYCGVLCVVGALGALSASCKETPRERAAAHLRSDQPDAAALVAAARELWPERSGWAYAFTAEPAGDAWQLFVVGTHAESSYLQATPHGMKLTFYRNLDEGNGDGSRAATMLAAGAPRGLRHVYIAERIQTEVEQVHYTVVDLLHVERVAAGLRSSKQWPPAAMQRLQPFDSLLGASLPKPVPRWPADKIDAPNLAR